MLKLRIFLFAFVFSTFTTFMPSRAMELNRERFVVIGCAVSLGLVGGLYAYSPAFKAFSQKFFQFFCFSKGKEVAVQEEGCRDIVLYQPDNQLVGKEKEVIVKEDVCRAIVPYEGPESQVKGVQENCRAIVLYQPDNQLVDSKFDRDAFEQAYYEIVGNDDPKVKALYQEVCEYLLSNSESSLDLYISEQKKARIQADFEVVFSAMIDENDRNVQAKNWCTFKDLLVKGANPNVFSKDGYFTPLLYACMNNELEAVQLLLKYPAIDINLSGSRVISCAPLKMACQRGNDEIVELLLGAGADHKNISDSLFLSLLGVGCVADANKNHNIIKLLLGAGADSNIVITQYGATSLMLAHSFDVMQEFIKYGADVNYRRNDGMSVLDCQLGRLCYGLKEYEDVNKCISLLINNGCNINSQDAKGYTALHRISQNSCIALDKMIHFVPILLDNGADLRIKDNRGRTAFDCAYNDDVKDILKVSYLHSPAVKDRALLLLGVKHANNNLMMEK